MYKKLFVAFAVIVVASTYGCAEKELSFAPKIKFSDNFCQGCRSVVTFMGHFNSTSSRSEYKDIFRGFCELYYPVSTDYQQGPCPLFVETLFYIIDKTDAVNHCDQIGACGHYESLSQTTTENVINTMPTRNGEVICNVCQQMVQQAKALLDDEALQAKLNEIIESLCDYLKPLNEDKDCRNFLYRNILKLASFIKSMDSKKYCQSIELCPAYSSVIAHKSSKLPSLTDFNNFGVETSVTIDGVVKKDISAPVNAAPDCVFCKTFVREMFKFLKDNRTEVNIRDGLDRVCKLVFHDKLKLDQCEGMVRAYSKELIEILTDETDPELICTLLDLCVPSGHAKAPITSSANLVPEVKPAPKKTGSSLVTFGDFMSMLDPTLSGRSARACFECKLFVKYLQSSLEDPKSQEQIQQWLLKNVCEPLEEDSLKGSCIQMVNTYANAFFRAVSEELNPAATCVELGACQAKQNILLINNVPAQTRRLPKIKPRKSKNHDGSVCEQCVEIITKIDDYLSQNSINQDVSVVIDQVCHKFPSDSLRNQCTILVKTLGQDIAQAVSTMDNPRQLCSKFLLCEA